MAVVLNASQRHMNAMSARAAGSPAARIEWHTDTCGVTTIPTVGTNLAGHPTGFGFKPYDQRPKETLL